MFEFVLLRLILEETEPPDLSSGAKISADFGRFAMNSYGFLIYFESSKIGLVTLICSLRSKIQEKPIKQTRTPLIRKNMNHLRPRDISVCNYSLMTKRKAEECPTMRYMT